SFAYDAAGRLSERTLPDGQTVTFTYDANGNLTGGAPPERSMYMFGYSSANLRQDYTAPDSGTGIAKTAYLYDTDKKLTRITLPDGVTVRFGYDSGGRLTSTEMPRGTIRYAYDPVTGVPVAITSPDGGSVSYAYDGALITGTTWTGSVAGSVDRGYDVNLHLA